MREAKSIDRGSHVSAIPQHTYVHAGPLGDLSSVRVPDICTVTYMVDWAVVMVILQRFCVNSDLLYLAHTISKYGHTPRLLKPC